MSNNPRNRILIVLPEFDYDPSEVVIPWKLLSAKSFDVVFSGPVHTAADPHTLTGDGLGLFKSILKARDSIIPLYESMLQCRGYQNKFPWEKINPLEYDAMILPGGHAPGMKSYLESDLLAKKILEFYQTGKPLAAICHGVLRLARTMTSENQSILFTRKTTTLLKSQELSAWILTYPWLKNYYRTYPETTQDEVVRLIGGSKYFYCGPTPLLRDSEQSLSSGFVVKDGQFITARWPGDAHSFANAVIKALE